MGPMLSHRCPCGNGRRLRVGLLRPCGHRRSRRQPARPARADGFRLRRGALRGGRPNLGRRTAGCVLLRALRAGVPGCRLFAAEGRRRGRGACGARGVAAGAAEVLWGARRQRPHRLARSHGRRASRRDRSGRGGHHRNRRRRDASCSAFRCASFCGRRRPSAKSWRRSGDGRPKGFPPPTSCRCWEARAGHPRSASARRRARASWRRFWTCGSRSSCHFWNGGTFRSAPSPDWRGFPPKTTSSASSSRDMA